ncbi:MAG: MotA/TolQ/ExbB proton channel family protein [Pseudomonadota bacterium]
MTGSSRRYGFEFFFQLTALVIVVIAVHAVYVTTVRPLADAIMEQQAQSIEADPNYVPERSVYIVIRDFEQETCFILLLWALAIIGLKGWEALGERRMLDGELIPLAEGLSILPSDTREYARPVQALPDGNRQMLLPRALLTALHRFSSTRNVQDTSTAVRSVCDAESDRLDSELALVRYIAWAIPSVGFIGTVRGIGAALGEAHKAVEGDITGVTANLGVAFNSTFVALLLSIVLMFVLYQLQQFQERLVLDTQSYCDEHLIARLQVRGT